MASARKTCDAGAVSGRPPAVFLRAGRKSGIAILANLFVPGTNRQARHIQMPGLPAFPANFPGPNAQTPADFSSRLLKYWYTNEIARSETPSAKYDRILSPCASTNVSTKKNLPTDRKAMTSPKSRIVA